MALAILALAVGLALLAWSAERFLDGSVMTARHLGLPPLLIGMVIVGFGTSAPEMLVAALAASQGNPGLALGNAYGSNIANIALILGLTALICPIAVHSRVLRRELPLLTAVTVLAALQLWDGELTRLDGWGLLLLLAGMMGWSLRQGLQRGRDPLARETERELRAHPMSLWRALFLLLLGLGLLIISSRLLVWGAVEIARHLGISDIVIGLTIVAVGTSLPELASSLAAARRGEHDIALGNVLGSNLFNTLAVVGIAAVIRPMAVPLEVIQRDIPVTGGLTLSLFLFGFGAQGSGHIGRLGGLGLLATYLGYNAWLVRGMVASLASS